MKEYLPSINTILPTTYKRRSDLDRVADLWQGFNNLSVYIPVSGRLNSDYTIAQINRNFRELEPGKYTAKQLLGLLEIDRDSHSYKALPLEFYINPRLAFCRLIVGSHSGKIAALLPYLTYKRQFSDEVFKLGNRLYRIDLSDSLLPLSHVFEIPLSKADRIGLRIESESELKTRKVESKVKTLPGYWHHSLAKSAPVNLFEFNAKKLEVKINTAHAGKGNIAGIYARCIAVGFDNNWHRVGCLKALSNGMVQTEIEFAKLDLIEFFKHVPEVLKSLGLLGYDYLRGRKDTVASDAIFWQGLDCELIANELNKAIKVTHSVKPVCPKPKR